MMEKRKIKQELLEWLKSIGISAALLGLLFGFVLLPITVDGSSMEPTLQHGDRVMALRNFYTPQHGDIVILSEDSGIGKVLVKRIVATAGQTVDIDEEGYLLVDGRRVEEDYIADLIDYDKRGDHDYPHTVAENCVFVMGDNRNYSGDSRLAAVGDVHEDEIMGKVFWQFFPFSQFGLVR